MLLTHAPLARRPAGAGVPMSAIWSSMVVQTLRQAYVRHVKHNSTTLVLLAVCRDAENSDWCGVDWMMLTGVCSWPLLAKGCPSLAGMHVPPGK
jgi:hypothetical protein